MNNNLPVPKINSSPGLKSDLVKILILAIGSFIAGFLLIFFFLRPGGHSSPVPESDAQVASSGDRDALDLPGHPTASAQSQPGSNQVSHNSAAIIPAGPLPDDLKQTQNAYYLMCWDKSGLEHDGSECDALSELEKRFNERLYVVKQCITDKAGTGTTGKLSLAAEINFEQNNVSFWNGASSTIKNASKIGDCLRTSLAGLPIDNISHDFERYRIFFTLQAGYSTATSSSSITDNQPPSATASPSEPPPGDGKMVAVIKDKVRVRKEPVNGEIIGKISAPNKVRFLKKDGAWCNIVTPNNNTGWMICDALEL